MLGFEVDNFLEILIKTSNPAEFIESDIQNIEAPRVVVVLPLFIDIWYEVFS